LREFIGSLGHGVFHWAAGAAPNFPPKETNPIEQMKKETFSFSFLQ